MKRVTLGLVGMLLGCGGASSAPEASMLDVPVEKPAPDESNTLRASHMNNVLLVARPEPGCREETLYLPGYSVLPQRPLAAGETRMHHGGVYPLGDEFVLLRQLTYRTLENEEIPWVQAAGLVRNSFHDELQRVLTICPIPESAFSDGTEVARRAGYGGIVVPNMLPVNPFRGGLRLYHPLPQTPGSPVRLFERE